MNSRATWELCSCSKTTVTIRQAITSKTRLWSQQSSARTSLQRKLQQRVVKASTASLLIMIGLCVRTLNPSLSSPRFNKRSRLHSVPSPPIVTMHNKLTPVPPTIRGQTVYLRANLLKQTLISTSSDSRWAFLGAISVLKNSRQMSLFSLQHNPSSTIS